MLVASVSRRVPMGPAGFPMSLHGVPIGSPSGPRGVPVGLHRIPRAPWGPRGSPSGPHGEVVGCMGASRVSMWYISGRPNSMYMLCPYDIGRDSWDREGQQSVLFCNSPQELGEEALTEGSGVSPRLQSLLMLLLRSRRSPLGGQVLSQVTCFFSICY